MGKLVIDNLHVSVEGREIITGLSLTIRQGETHALMGPNGSGKSTLAYALMGHPNYKLKKQNEKCKIILDKKNIIDKKPHQRARLGLFLAFQNPLTASGVPIASFLRIAAAKVHNLSIPSRAPGRHGWIKNPPFNKPKTMNVFQFNKMLEKKAALLGLDKMFLRRSLNDGFSGGEKKKAEMLQALVLAPKFVIFDEIDTGLDIDALKMVAGAIKQLAHTGSGILLITHYQRILNFVKPDFVHVLINGKIVQSGNYNLAKTIEKEGYRSITSNTKIKMTNKI